jgi:hypothetical protein
MNMYEIILEEIQDSYLALSPTDKVNNDNQKQTLELANYYSSCILENLKNTLDSLIKISLSLDSLFNTELSTNVLISIHDELDNIKLGDCKKHSLYTIHMPIIPEIEKETFFNLSKHIFYGIANLKHYDAIKTHINPSHHSNKNTLEILILLSNKLPLLTV